MKPVKRLRTRASLLVQKLPFSAYASASRVTMYDNAYLSGLPGGGPAYAGYVNGIYNTWPGLVSRFESSGADLLSIDVFGSGFAHCLDVEPGDAGNGAVLPWFRRMMALGVPMPVIYTSASNVQAIINILMGAGYKRDQFLIWSAHYTFRSHICALPVCGMPAADGTQWSDAGPGGCDVSALASYFFPWTLHGNTPAPTPAPAPTPPPAPKPPVPQPYPAPKTVTQDHTVYAGVFEPVVVDGKLILDYTVRCVQLNGVIHSTQRVTQPSFTLTGLTPGWQYTVMVWPNGGPIAPSHTSLNFTA